MKSNISKLDFVSDEVDLYELAKQVNIVNEEEVIDKETIEKIISLGLTNKVLNVIPYRIASVKSPEDFLDDDYFQFFYDNYSLFEICQPGYHGCWCDIYAIPKHKYYFKEWYKQGGRLPDLKDINDAYNKVIVLMPEHGYVILEMQYIPLTPNKNVPGQFIFSYQCGFETEKKYWFSFEKKHNGSWLAHILQMPYICKEKAHHRTYSSETGYHYVDWSTPVYSLENIIKIAKKWADYDYEKRGGATIKNWMKLVSCNDRDFEGLHDRLRNGSGLYIFDNVKMPETCNNAECTIEFRYYGEDKISLTCVQAPVPYTGNDVNIALWMENGIVEFESFEEMKGFLRCFKQDLPDNANITP